jgi:hypothetical protein
MRTMRTVGSSIAVAILLLVPAGPSAAHWPARCGTGQSLVRIEDRECPQHPPRRAALVQRVCCKNKAGHVQCHPMPPCPPVSPS